MTGFELQTSGIGSNHSTNWATTTSLIKLNVKLIFKQLACWPSILTLKVWIPLKLTVFILQNNEKKPIKINRFLNGNRTVVDGWNERIRLKRKNRLFTYSPHAWPFAVNLLQKLVPKFDLIPIVLIYTADNKRGWGPSHSSRPTSDREIESRLGYLLWLAWNIKILEIY